VSSDCTNIDQRKLKVMKLLTNIEKKGKNAHQNYEYVGIEDVVKAFRPAFIEAGISFRCHVEKWQIIDKVIIFDYEITFTNVDDQTDSDVLRSTAIISPINDTAPGKAAAYAVKNALTKNFLIPAGRGEDVEFFDKGTAAMASATARVKSQETAKPAPAVKGKVDKLIDDLYECESIQELKGVWKELGSDIPQDVWDKALPVYKKLQRALNN